MRIVVYQGKGGQWYWRTVAANFEKTSQSEGYTTRASAVRAAKKHSATTGWPITGDDPKP